MGALQRLTSRHHGDGQDGRLHRGAPGLHARCAAKSGTEADRGHRVLRRQRTNRGAVSTTVNWGKGRPKIDSVVSSTTTADAARGRRHDHRYVRGATDQSGNGDKAFVDALLQAQFFRRRAPGRATLLTPSLACSSAATMTRPPCSPPTTAARGPTRPPSRSPSNAGLVEGAVDGRRLLGRLRAGCHLPRGRPVSPAAPSASCCGLVRVRDGRRDRTFGALKQGPKIARRSPTTRTTATTRRTGRARATPS